MRIGVDARVLELPCPTGVERAAAEILRALPAVLPDGAEAVVLSRGPVALRPAGRMTTLEIGGPESALIWRETHLAPSLGRMRIDVLWSPVTAIPMRTNVPRVATFHEAPWLVRPGIEGRLREGVHALRLRLAVAAAARIICPSRASAAQIEALHPGTSGIVRVVPHGVPPRFFAPRDAALEADAAARRKRLGIDGPYLLQVGGARPRKNVPFLLRAFARFRLRGGAASLVIAGPGEPPASAPRGVRTLGWVDDADLLALYDGATALVVASEAEGFGIPVLEAMARGTPVVALPTGGVVEAAGDAALLIGGAELRDGAAEGASEEAFATALLRVERDPAFRELLSVRGRRRADTARWEDAARSLVGVLAECVTRRPAVGDGALTSRR